MRTPFRSLVAAGVVLTAAACNDVAGPPREISALPRDLSVAELGLVASDNRFAFKLFGAINRDEHPDSNVFVSPLSAAMALGMAYNGAAGATRDAMQETLELQDLTIDEVNASYRSLIDLLRDLDPAVEFVIANSIWHRLGFTPRAAFLDVADAYFDAEVAGLDFADPSASRTINGWVAEQTRDRIPKIVPDAIPPDVIAYLINAIYFKGAWTFRFDEDLTAERPFTVADGSTVVAPLMAHDDEVPVRYAGLPDVQVVDLPYGGRAFSMTVILPTDPAGIRDVAGRLDQATWDGWIAALDSTSLFVSIPKFRLEYGLNMNGVLQALGMEEAFCETGVSPDFSAMFAVAPGDVCITNVEHKAFVDVSEEGTEAAAATSVEIGVVSLPLRFVVDRPFLFAIRERFSGTILFMGKMMDPTVESVGG